MHTSYLRTALALGVGLAAGAMLTQAFADSPQPSPRDSARQPISIAQVYGTVAAAGHANVEKIERKADLFKVETAERNGERATLYVDTHSGTIVDRRAEARDRDRFGKRHSAEVKRHNEEGKRRSADCTARRCRDDRPPTLNSESLGWYLKDSHGRISAAGM